MLSDIFFGDDRFKRRVRALLYHINEIGGDIFPRCISQSNLALNFLMT